jgi:hypothetical protein
MTISTRLFLLPLGFGLGCLAACHPTKTILNDEHCAVNGGDVYCAQQFPDKPFCQLSACNGDDSPQWGCVAEQPSAECWAECGVEVIMTDGGVELGDLIPCDGTDTESSGSETADTTDSTDATETTGPMLCQGPEDCVDPALPFCDMNGACVACDAMPDPDGACAGADANLPVCFEGSCVACAEGKTDACVGTTPICNTETNVCEGCSEHEQCPDSACNMAAGNCMDPGVVVHVDAANPNCPAADGTEGNPYCTISAALANSGAEVVIVLHEKNGMVEYAETNSIAKPVALFAAMGELPIVRAAGPNPTLTVSPTGALFMRGVRLGNGPASGMLVNGGSAWIERSEIVNNSGGGIVVDGGGVLMLENSFVGGDDTGIVAVDIQDGSGTILYSTLGAGFGAAAASLRCVDGSTSTMRNSIVVSYSASPEIDCPQLGQSANFEEADTAMVFDDQANWFGDFAAGNFHLNPGMYPTEIETAALWELDDPTTDIDGDPRPVTDGTPDFAGADRIP